MKTKLTDSKTKQVSSQKNENREEITLCVLAAFFVITLGLLVLSQV